tara:strand:+ start:1196 stop:2134 length:939 start_codon:yes stop_codon:yes gene_type:complete
MSSRSFYDILGVSKNATTEQIKKEFRKLSLKYHPDKPNGDEEKFKEINEAYQTLSNDEKRRQYDNKNPGNYFNRTNRGGFNHPMYSSGGGFNGDPMNDMFSSMFNHGNFPFHFSNDMNNNPNIKIFRNGVEVNNKNIIPETINTNIKITMKQSYEGVSIPLDISRTIIRNQEKTKENESIYVEIPKGVGNNETIVMKNLGNIINEKKSDLKIKIILENTNEFERDGLDIIYKKNISLKEALCGFSFNLSFINGKIYTINNNSGNIIYPGYLKELPNMGFTRGNNTGKLIIKFSISFPEKIDKENIEKLKDLL